VKLLFWVALLLLLLEMEAEEDDEDDDPSPNCELAPKPIMVVNYSAVKSFQ
jgi:hypothetical protein